MVGNGAVSVIIPCFNSGRTLGESIQSLERVGAANVLEVIIVNDGSTDPETCQLLERLSGDYKVLHQSNKGLGAARNSGIQHAGGEFILPLDSDNLIRLPYFTSGVELLSSNATLGVVYGNVQCFGEKTERIRVPDFDLLSLCWGNYIDACALFRKSVWASVGGYDEQMPWMGYEDWDFWLRVALQGWRFEHIDESSFDYRVSADSMINRETKLHHAELAAYIIGKRENRVVQLLRDSDTECRRLKQIEQSPEYRVGRVLLRPVRAVRASLRRDRARPA